MAEEPVEDVAPVDLVALAGHTLEVLEDFQRGRQVEPRQDLGHLADAVVDATGPLGRVPGEGQRIIDQGPGALGLAQVEPVVGHPGLDQHPTRGRLHALHIQFRLREQFLHLIRGQIAADVADPRVAPGADLGIVAGLEQGRRLVEVLDAPGPRPG